MFVKVLSSAIIGIDAVFIKVEVDVSLRGFPKFNIVGLPSKSVDEARERVRTAIINSGFKMPETRITVTLAPAHIPKNGAGLDLPIAVGIFAATETVPKTSAEDGLYVGELSLTGEIKKINGILATAILAQKEKIKKIFVPFENAEEACLIEGVDVRAPFFLKQLVLYLNKKTVIPVHEKKDFSTAVPKNSDFVFENIKGQETAKRALEIAAAGFHNVHLTGPPGAGKTFLAKSLPSIMPSLEESEMIEVVRIYSAAGLLNSFFSNRERPFRSPHHTVSRVGLIGGGTNPSPGEISLSHCGVLFLDEFPEFPRSAIESLRAPLEDGKVLISRASGSLCFPSRFILLAASNPCPCGYLGHPKISCRCLPGAIFNYRKKLSGPIMDRIDLNVFVSPVTADKLIGFSNGETSLQVKARVIKARKRQMERFKGLSIRVNSLMTPKEIKKYCRFSNLADQLLKRAIDRFCLSARGYFKIIKIARTIADLKNIDLIDDSCLAEALQFRSSDGKIDY